MSALDGRRKMYPVFTRDTTRTDVPQLPAASAYGEGPAWVDGELEHSLGDFWRLKTRDFVVLKKGISYADENTLALQSALDAGGSVEIAGKKGDVFYISGTVYVGDDTNFYVPPGVTLRSSATSGATGFSLIRNKAYNNTDYTVSALTSSATVCTLTTSTNHDFVVGDVVMVNWAEPEYYSGTFIVASVPAANQITYKTFQIPSASTATTLSGQTMKVRRGNKLISVQIDGTLDYNTGATAINTQHSLMCIFYGVYNLKVFGRYINALKYNMLIANCTNFRVDADTQGPSDGIHIQGPVWFGEVERSFGNNNDNQIGVGTGDYASYMISAGSIYGLKINNVKSNNPVMSPVRFFGSSKFSIMASFDGVYGNEIGVAPVEVLIDPLVQPNGNVWVKWLDIAHLDSDYGSFAYYAKIIADRVDFLSLDVSNIKFINANGAFVYWDKTTLAGQLVLRNCKNVGGSSTKFVNIIATATAVPEIFLDTFITTLGSFGITTASTADTIVHASNCSFSGANSSSSVVRSSAASGTMKLYSASSTYGNMTSAMQKTSTANLEAYGWDIPQDVATLAATDGQFCRNTNAAQAGGTGLARNLAGTWALI